MEQSDCYPHPSIQALLTEALPGENAHDVIRRKARQIVAKHSNLWTGPPFCPVILADLEGIIVEQASCDIRSDGRIFSKGTQVYIQFAEGQSHERVRFTICHELAHTLFSDCYTRERRRSPAEQAEWEFENLCNIAAAEFLFPMEEFTRDIGVGQLSADQIKNLAGRYQASIDATARRYVTTCQVPVCILFAQYREPTGKTVVTLFGQYSVPNDKFPQKFFKGFKINSKSIANEALRRQQPLGAKRESWMVAGKWCAFRVEAIPLPKFASKETADLAVALYPA